MAEKKMYRVRCTAPGNFGLSMRKVGEEFEIEHPRQFSDVWMEALDEIPGIEKAPAMKASAQKKAERAVSAPVSDESPL